MSFNPIALVATIVGGLIVAGLVGWIRKPRLVVLLPRSFSYSQITDRGQLVEISVFNRGFKTEEAVEVTLNHMLRYELVGSNSQDATVASSKIHVPRIGPSDEVTVLLLVEQGTFKRDDIVQCLSKETKGVAVGKLEEVPPTGPQRIAVLGLFVLVPALLYGLTFVLDYASDILNKSAAPVAITQEKREPTEIQGWKVPWFHVGTSTLVEPFKSGRIKATVGDITRKGDVAAVPVSFTNLTDEVLKARVSMTSAHSERRFKPFELRAEVGALTPGKTEIRSVQVVIPQSAASRSEQTAFIEVHLENMYGQALSLHTEREVK